MEKGLPFNIDIDLLTDPLVHYTYDLAGRRTMREMNNNSETDYAYDNAGRVTLIEHKNGAGTFDKREYGYNSVNNRAWEKHNSALGDAYAYDATRQVTGVQYDVSNPDTTPASPASQTAFDYDAVGNREVVTQTTGTSAPVPTTYTANNLNQYTAIGGNSPTYDTNGNLATMASGTFTYDAQNRLTSVSSGTNTMAINYDGRNRCVSRTINGATTYYAYDGWNTIEEYDGTGSQLAAIAHGAGVDEYVFRWSAGYILCYYHQDALGNVTTLTDTSGVPTEKYTYDVFGKPRIWDTYGLERSASLFGNRFLFTGREWHGETRVYMITATDIIRRRWGASSKPIPSTLQQGILTFIGMSQIIQ